MALSTQNKWIVGIASVLGLTLLALAFKDKWMPKKDIVQSSQDNSVISGKSGGITFEFNQNATPKSGELPKNYAKVEELHKIFAANPPKTSEEAKERAKQFGVTEEDAKNYMAYKFNFKT